MRTINQDRPPASRLGGDIQKILDEKLKLPDGYYYNYGGEFENLQSATNGFLW